MAKQLHLFRKPRRPAKSNPRTLHVSDAGSAGVAGRYGVVTLCCDLCGHETEWLPARSVTVELKGRVCPKCKGDPATVKPSGGTADKEPS
ncbi:hypothetical protein D3877_10275 [Azospirillum cavernae]|uniref:Uncharacterized protein n=1 Tax=Azospirillum cavernae TaxID=2320860 RepID=A0A418W4B3_9PROT|nr:hypothetical protein [Azospirillum cavernae]RJF84855.1 hypothetical protein D3877_10275 [Azospirillum cavernae]